MISASCGFTLDILGDIINEWNPPYTLLGFFS